VQSVFPNTLYYTVGYSRVPYVLIKVLCTLSCTNSAIRFVWYAVYVHISTALHVAAVMLKLPHVCANVSPPHTEYVATHCAVGSGIAVTTYKWITISAFLLSTISFYHNHCFSVPLTHVLPLFVMGLLIHFPLLICWRVSYRGWTGYHFLFRTIGKWRW
jgi:hypothetical protein